MWKVVGMVNRRRKDGKTGREKSGCDLFSIGSSRKLVFFVEEIACICNGWKFLIHYDDIVEVKLICRDLIDEY